MSSATTSMPATSSPTTRARLDGPGGHVGMHDVGDIFSRAAGAQVGAVPQEDGLLGLGHAVGGEPLLRQHGQRPRRRSRSG